MKGGLIERYRAYLPVTDKTPIVTLLEGNTPLIPARYLPDALGIKRVLHFALEHRLYRSTTSDAKRTALAAVPRTKSPLRRRIGESPRLLFRTLCRERVDDGR